MATEFNWTDELVKEFLLEYSKGVEDGQMAHFKRWHNLPMTQVEQPRDKIIKQIGRLEGIDEGFNAAREINYTKSFFDDHYNQLKFSFINCSKYKTANDYKQSLNQSTEQKPIQDKPLPLFTQEQLDEAMGKAYSEGRKTGFEDSLRFKNLYSQTQVDKMCEDAFNAATKIDFRGRHTVPYYQYPTFQDYKKSKQ